MAKILVIDDEAAICTSLTFALEDDYEVTSTTDPYEGLNWAKQEAFDICLLDLKIGSVNGIDILVQLKEEQPDLVVIMMTAYASISSTVEAVKKGAYFYLSKPLQMEELFSVIKQALNYQTLHRQVQYLTQELERKYGYKEIIGKSVQMNKVFQLIDRVKDIDTNVLITGESGTGKELVARAIHFSGKRKQEHFEVVNCAAIPEHLLESELFGHEKGAFTGALAKREGKFALANPGTIFLDEIGDMPLSLQVKLLRVIQQREITPLGSDKTIKLNVRIIAATNRDLKQAIADGDFREDLYFRLNVVEIGLPALRERKEDIPFLVHHFIEKNNQELNKVIKGLTPEAMDALNRYSFPGNVRELANMVEAAMVMSDGEYIDVKDLSEAVREENFPRNNPIYNLDSCINALAGMKLKEIEERVILATLMLNNGHRKQTADMLGISERGLRDKLNQYKLNKS